MIDLEDGYSYDEVAILLEGCCELCPLNQSEEAIELQALHSIPKLSQVIGKQWTCPRKQHCPVNSLESIPEGYD